MHAQARKLQQSLHLLCNSCITSPGLLMVSPWMSTSRRKVHPTSFMDMIRPVPLCCLWLAPFLVLATELLIPNLASQLFPPSVVLPAPTPALIHTATTGNLSQNKQYTHTHMHTSCFALSLCWENPFHSPLPSLASHAPRTVCTATVGFARKVMTPV